MPAPTYHESHNMAHSLERYRNHCLNCHARAWGNSRSHEHDTALERMCKKKNKAPSMTPVTDNFKAKEDEKKFSFRFVEVSGRSRPQKIRWSQIDEVLKSHGRLERRVNELLGQLQQQ